MTLKFRPKLAALKSLTNSEQNTEAFAAELDESAQGSRISGAYIPLDLGESLKEEPACQSSVGGGIDDRIP